MCWGDGDGVKERLGELGIRKFRELSSEFINTKHRLKKFLRFLKSVLQKNNFIKDGNI